MIPATAPNPITADTFKPSTPLAGAGAMSASGANAGASEGANPAGPSATGAYASGAKAGADDGDDEDEGSSAGAPAVGDNEIDEWAGAGALETGAWAGDEMGWALGEAVGEPWGDWAETTAAKRTRARAITWRVIFIGF
ncbi:hypothetical protein CASFOL_033109 [Castilleja foliolosa]|uniref:Uncharacterized protein n=1 Tax=Castilleja foliolosa TaxID=1961234 RepID=A0ABD3C3D1_9LAMI